MLTRWPSCLAHCRTPAGPQARAQEVLHGARAIDKRTLREFDDGCLVTLTPIEPGEIRLIRKSECVSQLVLARYLGVSKSLVSEWECGTRRPRGPALKLLTIIRWHQPHLVPKPGRLARPVMRRPAGFRADQTWWQLLEEWQHLRSSQRLANDDLAVASIP